MIHLKQYETWDTTEGKKYWLLPTDERFKKSLEKINCDPNQFINNNKIKTKYVFIRHDGDYTHQSDKRWGWIEYNGKITNDYYDELGYEYQGTINIDGNDPEIEMTTNKYNL